MTVPQTGLTDSFNKASDVDLTRAAIALFAVAEEARHTAPKNGHKDTRPL